MLVRPEGDNAALVDNVNPDSPRRASVANKPRHMQPCCLPSLAYIPLILASSLCCTKNRAERGSLLPKEVGGYLWSTRLRSFGISKRPTAGHWSPNNTKHRRQLECHTQHRQYLGIMIYRKENWYEEYTLKKSLSLSQAKLALSFS
jgi:hypothetical protein